MFNVGGGELLVILLVALIVLGPQRLPDAARQVGRVMGDIRRISGGFQQELKDAFDPGDEPTRRQEPVPLARAVADADPDDKAPGAPAETGDAGPRPLREVATRDASSLAPAVADALDEIVTPRPAPADESADLAAESAADTATSDDRRDGLGGARAAS